VLPIYDELFQQSEVEHILVRHEQGAGHAAEGYARSTGQPGVVLVTSGPGATNMVTPLTDALMDSIPLVCITGQVPTHLIGNDAFQECDTVGITRPCTKHNWLVRDVNDLAKVLHEAFYVASTGRPGPVLVDVPKDVQFAVGTYHPPRKSDVHVSYAPRVKGDAAQIRKAVALLASAKRPVIYSGGGVINSGPEASKLLRELVEVTGFPITSTLMGLGALMVSAQAQPGDGEKDDKAEKFPEPPKRRCPALSEGFSSLVMKMMQKRPEKRYANMGEVADALEAWLVNHGYRFEPGSGEAAAKAAVLTAGGPIARRGGGGGSFGGSRGSFASGTQRITGSGTGGVRPKVVPNRHDDTVYDKARVDTKKGDSGLGKSSGSSSKKPGGKPLPVAKSLDGLPGDKLPGDKKTASGANPVVTSGSVTKSGPQPAVNVAGKSTSGAMPTVKTESGVRMSGPQSVVTAAPTINVSKEPTLTSTRAASKKPSAMPQWMLVGGGIALAVVFAAIIIALVMSM
jgi:hypothetical protein